jgi:hypothetical protein|tara:strand:+ start:1005 stop:1406 length:402 start_codon:yes stop_codon:yes gene_type:complete
MKIALYAITAFVGALVALWLSGSVLYEGRRLVLMDGVFFDVGLVGSILVPALYLLAYLYTGWLFFRNVCFRAPSFLLAVLANVTACLSGVVIAYFFYDVSILMRWAAGLAVIGMLGSQAWFISRIFLVSATSD